MKSKIIYISIFAILGFGLLQLPVNNLAGTGAKLTFFDMFYPVSGALLGGVYGMLAVVLMQFLNLAMHNFAGVSVLSFLTILATIRILPMLAGVLTFSKVSSKVLIIPALGIVSFLANPIGREAWIFTLFWLIPFAAWPARNKFLVARSLVSTFSSHAAGGAIWVWAFPTTSAFWITLMPIVALERSIFALGISGSYILINNLGYLLQQKEFIPAGLKFNKKYILLK